MENACWQACIKLEISKCIYFLPSKSNIEWQVYSSIQQLIIEYLHVKIEFSVVLPCLMSISTFFYLFLSIFVGQTDEKGLRDYANEIMKIDCSENAFDIWTVWQQQSHSLNNFYQLLLFRQCVENVRCKLRIIHLIESKHIWPGYWNNSILTNFTFRSFTESNLCVPFWIIIGLKKRWHYDTR